MYMSGFMQDARCMIHCLLHACRCVPRVMREDAHGPFCKEPLEEDLCGRRGK